MKAILVLDKIPESCEKCRFHFSDYDANDCLVDVCIVLSPNGVVIDGYTEKYDRCPLKPIPERKPQDNPNGRNMYRAGWNDCLDKILGE